MSCLHAVSIAAEEVEDLFAAELEVVDPVDHDHGAVHSAAFHPTVVAAVLLLLVTDQGVVVHWN